jgi:hypothetical protein
MRIDAPASWRGHRYKDYAAAGAHAFLIASALVMAAAGAAFTFVAALRADARAGPQGERC